jgi:uncharacterized protein YhaN
VRRAARRVGPHAYTVVHDSNLRLSLPDLDLTLESEAPEKLEQEYAELSARVAALGLSETELRVAAVSDLKSVLQSLPLVE